MPSRLPADLMNRDFYEGALPRHPDPVLLPNQRIDFDIAHCPKRMKKTAICWMIAGALVFGLGGMLTWPAMGLGVICFAATASGTAAGGMMCFRQYAVTLERSRIISAYRVVAHLPLSGDLETDTTRRFYRNVKTGRIAKPMRLAAAGQHFWQSLRGGKAQRRRHLRLALHDMGRFLGR